MVSLGSVTPPIIKNDPHRVGGRRSDAEAARNKAVTGLKQKPFCMTTSTSLGELTAGNTRGRRNARLHPPHHHHPRAGASFTCATLRTTPPPLAGVGSHRQLDPQRLAAAGGMVDGGVDDLVDGVKEAGDVLQERGDVNLGPHLEEDLLHVL